ncbi:hypothetical protein [Enterococcus sp. LJL51]|uniref:hypothetical protein n=1 Tax=Enterococcus sp. LJL51 TaxID=3416656 RepID=UPI003CF26681
MSSRTWGKILGLETIGGIPQTVVDVFEGIFDFLGVILDWLQNLGFEVVDDTCVLNE